MYKMVLAFILVAIIAFNASGAPAMAPAPFIVPSLMQYGGGGGGYGGGHQGGFQRINPQGHVGYSPLSMAMPMGMGMGMPVGMGSGFPMNSYLG